MKILFIHTGKFHCKPIFNKKATKHKLPKDINLSLIKNDAVIAFVCMEEGDDKSKLDKFEKECIKIINNLGVKNLIIFPFAHLSSKLLDYEVAKSLYEKIVKNSQKLKEVKVDCIPYGYDKSFEMEVKGHSYNVMWRDL